MAEDPFSLLEVIFEEDSSMFNPEKIVKYKIGVDHLGNSFTDAISKMDREGDKGWRGNDIVELWIHNAHVLYNHWRGDPLNIYKGAKDFEEAFQRIDHKRMPSGMGIRGMRRKIFSLYTIFLQEKNLIPYFPTPIPVDFHALRLLIDWGILSLKKIKISDKSERYPDSWAGYPNVRVSEALIDEVTVWSQDFIHSHGFNHLVINPALWVFSRSMCKYQWQASLYDDGDLVMDNDVTIDHLSKAGLRFRDQPCHNCIFDERCTLMIPSRPYYKVGMLMILDRISKPPTLQLPLALDPIS